MPKVSVILTSYNHAKYLRESIESVLNQTFSDFELIIGDDASTDESWDIIQGYTDPRIHTFRNETNLGGGIIHRVISGKISSDYIAIQHSDDVWEPQKLEKQVAFLDKNPQFGAVFSCALIIGEDSMPLDDVSHVYYKIFDQPNRSRFEWLNYFFYRGNALCHPSMLIRRQCYDDCGVYRYGLAQLGDFDMWVRLCLNYEIHVMQEKLVRFRVRANDMNHSGNRPDARIRLHFELLQVLNNYRNILTFTEFVKVFPEAQKYFNPEGFDLGYILGMTALEAKLFETYELFGLITLFEALNDPKRAKKIEKLYNFKHRDFTELTGKFDLFSIEQKANLFTLLSEQGLQIQSLTEQLQSLTEQLQEIKISKAWRTAMVLRQIRLWVLPVGSRREKIVKICKEIITRFSKR